MDTTILIAGVDEAGRGALAGPVYAAAVILNAQAPITGLNDSKLLTAKKRETLAKEIQEKSIAWAVAYADVSEIEEIISSDFFREVAISSLLMDFQRRSEGSKSGL